MQYEAEFTALSRHAPQYISTQEEKCHRFLRGFRYQLRLALAHFDINEFSVLVERARRIENELNYSRSLTNEPSEKRKNFERRHDRFGKKPKSEVQQNSKQTHVERPICITCGRKHFGECLKGSSYTYEFSKPLSLIPFSVTPQVNP